MKRPARHDAGRDKDISLAWWKNFDKVKIMLLAGYIDSRFYGIYKMLSQLIWGGLGGAMCPECKEPYTLLPTLRAGIKSG
jgi:hypothetical protein